MQKKILFAVGGTGGHWFPAVALADQLKKKDPSISIAFAGGGVKNQSLLSQKKYDYHLVSSGPLTVKGVLKVAKGFQETCRFIEKKKPCLVIGFGSYYSLPVLLGAAWKKIPYILHEQNCIPGRVIRLFSRSAKVTCLHFPEAEKYLRGSCQLVGMPLRADFAKESISQVAAKEYFLLDPALPVVLIFGGSQGSSAINAMVKDGIEKSRSIGFQILHFTGSADGVKNFNQLYRQRGLSFCVKEYERRMEYAWQAADLCVSRAGACSIAEQIAFKVPSLLVPYPFAMDNHQMANALHFQKEVKGGILLEEGCEENLIERLHAMLERSQLKHYQNSIATYCKNREEKEFVEEILKYM